LDSTDCGYLLNSTVFQCPSFNKKQASAYDQRWAWHNNAPIGWAAGELSKFYSGYIPRFDNTNCHVGMQLNRASFKGGTAIMTELYMDTPSFPYWKNGHYNGERLNVLYGDGHVELKVNPKNTTWRNSGYITSFNKLDIQ